MDLPQYVRLCRSPVWRSWLVCLALTGHLWGCGTAAAVRDDDLQSEPSVSAADVARSTHLAANLARSDAGLVALTWDPALAAVAQRHADDMAERRYFAHDSPEGEGLTERMARARYRCEIVLPSGRLLTGAENLAMIPWAPSVLVRKDGVRQAAEVRDATAVGREAVRGWLDSPGHSANLLHPHLRSEGLGVHVQQNGQVLIVQVFC